MRYLETTFPSLECAYILIAGDGIQYTFQTSLQFPEQYCPWTQLTVEIGVQVSLQAYGIRSKFIH